VAKQPESAHAPALLVNSNDRFLHAHVAQTVDEAAQLPRTLDVAPEKNEATRLEITEKFCTFRIQFGSRHTDEDQLTKRICWHKVLHQSANPLIFQASHFSKFFMENTPDSPNNQHVQSAFAKLAGAKRLGLYGGSFDPVHFGHLILAREAMEQLGLDCVIFIPAMVSPHKEESPPASAKDRWDMVDAAIQDEDNFLIDNIEMLREGSSYTIDTVRAYRDKFPGAQIFYLIGGDNLAKLDTWREIETLQELVTFVILERGNAHEVPRGCELISRGIGISSSEIRNRVASGQSIRYLVPEMVHKIIRSRQIYVR